MELHYLGPKQQLVNKDYMLEISSELLKIIVCPVTKKPLTYDKQAQELLSEEAGLAFPVREGIPILLIDKARKLNKQNYIYKERVVTNEQDAMKYTKHEEEKELV